MPVLRRLADQEMLMLQQREGERDATYRLSAEGERFLTLVLGVAVDGEVGATDFQWLVDRGWAVREAEKPAPIVKLPPVKSSTTRGRRATNPPTAPTPEKAAAGIRPETQRVMLNRRTRGREVALQVLYLLEQNAGITGPQIDQFVQRRLLSDEKLQAFTHSLVKGVRENLQELDALISTVAENWRIDRMAAIDRNILRLGAFELIHCPDVPRSVAINEALELAKRYSTAQSSRFVNGILDRVQLGATAPPEPSAVEPSAESPALSETDATPAPEPGE